MMKIITIIIICFVAVSCSLKQVYLNFSNAENKDLLVVISMYGKEVQSMGYNGSNVLMMDLVPANRSVSGTKGMFPIDGVKYLRYEAFYSDQVDSLYKAKYGEEILGLDREKLNQFYFGELFDSKYSLWSYYFPIRQKVEIQVNDGEIIKGNPAKFK